MSHSIKKGGDNDVASTVKFELYSRVGRFKREKVQSKGGVHIPVRLPNCLFSVTLKEKVLQY